MTTQILRFVELSDEDRKETGRLGKLGKGDRVEVRVKRRSGPDQTLSLPPEAAALHGDALYSDANTTFTNHPIPVFTIISRSYYPTLAGRQ